MPIMDGLTAIKELRERERTGVIPIRYVRPSIRWIPPILTYGSSQSVIAVTGNARQSKSYCALGFDDVRLLPLSLSSLAHILAIRSLSSPTASRNCCSRSRKLVGTRPSERSLGFRDEEQVFVVLSYHSGSVVPYCSYCKEYRFIVDCLIKWKRSSEEQVLQPYDSNLAPNFPLCSHRSLQRHQRRSERKDQLGADVDNVFCNDEDEGSQLPRYRDGEFGYRTRESVIESCGD
jgi:CheY-like chemotaxis protein